MGEVHELQIESMTSQGDGLCHVNGQVVFVARALAGERVRAEVVEERKDFRRAVVQEVLAASPQRISPACPHYEECGGCQLQHLAYEDQRVHKAWGFVETLLRVGRVSIDPPPVHADAAWGYRNRVVFKVPRNGPPRLSLYHFADPGRNVPIATCLVLHPQLQRLLSPANTVLEAWCNGGGARPSRVLLRKIGEAAVIAWLFPAGRLASPQGLKKIAVGIPGIDGFVAFETDQWEDGLPSAHRHMLLGPEAYRVPRGPCWSLAGPENFLQVHDALADRMVAHIVALPYACAQRAAEIYCGVGLVALNLSSRFAEVWGLDYDRTAIARADQAAREQGLAGVHFIAAPAEKLQREVPGFPDRIDLALFNPPRKGIARRALEAVLARDPCDLVVASCHPATLARDLAILVDAGWRLADVSLWDLFPQTHHVEAVVHLVKGGRQA